jgi:hypothetical protein
MVGLQDWQYLDCHGSYPSNSLLATLVSLQRLEFWTVSPLKRRYLALNSNATEAILSTLRRPRRTMHLPALQYV